MEIPRCESCGKIAQYKCAIDGNYVCCECARFMPVSKLHIAKSKRPKIEIKVLDKMKQDPKERTILEALEDLTACPPPEKIDLKNEWKPWPGYVYGHKNYSVKTMAVHANGEPAGYLDFLFTMDPEEDMSIQFWEMAIHPKFQGTGLFSTMMKKLKQVAKENNVTKLYVSHENDNLPAIIAQYMLGGKILYVREYDKEETGRFGIPRRNDLIFQYQL